MSGRKKRRPRRRTYSPAPRAVLVRTTEARLQRASWVAGGLGAACLVAALAVQYRLVHFAVGPNSAVILKVAGVGLAIAGIIFGRNARR